MKKKKKIYFYSVPDKKKNKKTNKINKNINRKDNEQRTTFVVKAVSHKLKGPLYLVRLDKSNKQIICVKQTLFVTNTQFISMHGWN